MERYWFTTQDPKVPVSGRNGLWVSNYFRNSPPPSISVGDRVGIYEPEVVKQKGIMVRKL